MANTNIEGKDTTAYGDYSHAEGENTIASGIASHVEGFNNESKGDHSHAEGEGTISIGKASHASGYETIAHADYQTALGQYNTDKNTEDHFVVGIGDINTRADGFGINKTRTYISNSLVLPSLTENSQVELLTYNLLTKEVHYSSVSDLIIGNTNYATQALTASYAELAKIAQQANIATQANKADEAEIATTASYSEYAKQAQNAYEADTATQADTAKLADTASYVSLAQQAITASYSIKTQTADTASYINDPSLVKISSDIFTNKITEDYNRLALFKDDKTITYDPNIYTTKDYGAIGLRTIPNDLLDINATQNPSLGITLKGTLKLKPLSSLPAGTLGAMAVSGSDLYFHNGSEWKKVLLG